MGGRTGCKLRRDQHGRCWECKSYYSSTGKEVLNITENVLYAPQILNNLISSSQAHRNGFRTEIDVDTESPILGEMKLIHKRTGEVKLVALETDEGLYEAVLKNTSWESGNGMG